LSLLNLEDREHKVPELEFPLTVETNSVIFENAIEDAGIVADSVAFIVDKDKFLIKSEGNISDANVELVTDEETDIRMENEDKLMSKYSIEYLKKIVKGGKLADRVKVQFSKDYPLRVEYNVMDKLGLTFILAPRVSND